MTRERELLALLHLLQGFAEGEALGSLVSLGAVAAPALGSAWQWHCKLVTLVGTSLPRLPSTGSCILSSPLLFPLVVTWK